MFVIDCIFRLFNFEDTEEMSEKSKKSVFFAVLESNGDFECLSFKKMRVTSEKNSMFSSCALELSKNTNMKLTTKSWS